MATFKPTWSFSNSPLRNSSIEYFAHLTSWSRRFVAICERFGENMNGFTFSSWQKTLIIDVVVVDTKVRNLHKLHRSLWAKNINLKGSISVWLTDLLCFGWMNNSFTSCLVKSKPVKEEASCTVILPFKLVFSAWSETVELCGFSFTTSISLEQM